MTTIADSVYLAVRQMLADGKLAAGQRVSQVELAERLNCSTVPVIEALRRLESDGLLTKEPQKTARVRQLSARELGGLYLVREGLEGIAARLAATNINPEQAADLIELRAAFEAASDAADIERVNAQELAIHKMITQIADCPLLADQIERLALIERTAASPTLTAGAPGRRRGSHHAVVQAIIDHDPQGAQYLMQKHIQQGYEDLVHELEPPEGK